MTEIKEPLFYNCCTACGVGSSENTKEDIIAQIEKYGEFICKNCEESFNEILNSDEELIIETPLGDCETLITSDTIYKFEPDRPKVMRPGSPFLGFGGAWFLVVKDYKNKYGFRERKLMVTNNLFHVSNIPKPFQPLFREKNKINSFVHSVDIKDLIDFKHTLNSIPYLNQD